MRVLSLIPFLLGELTAFQQNFKLFQVKKDLLKLNV